MSKLNHKGVAKKINITEVAAKRGEQLGTSANGNLQFVKSSSQQLFERAVSTMYGKDSDSMGEGAAIVAIKQGIRTAVDQGNYNFVANLIIYVRSEVNLRTLPIVMTVEFIKALSDKREQQTSVIKNAIAALTPRQTAKREALNTELRLVTAAYNYVHARQLVCDVIQRADQLTDMYAYALHVFGDKRRVPMAIKRGVADAFNKFSAYQFAKYDRAGDVKLRDVLRIVHPTAKNDAQGAIFAGIMNNTLETPYTWETQLSANGQKSKAERLSDADLWTELVMSGKMNYMALMRNMRNIHQAGVDPEVIKRVASIIADPQQVAKSKQLPFDMYEAYQAIAPYNTRLATAVSKAIDYSAYNIPELGKRVWVIVDFSGSMGRDPMEYGGASGMSTDTPIATATTLAAALIKATAESADALVVTAFGSSAKHVQITDYNKSILDIKKDLLSHRKGSIAGSTNFRSALDMYPKLGFKPDTIIVLTDGEVNGFPYSVLKSIPTDIMKVTVNLNNASTTPMSQADGWYALSGWSTQMFRWIHAIREKESVYDKLSHEYIGLQRK